MEYITEEDKKNLDILRGEIKVKLNEHVNKKLSSGIEESIFDFCIQYLKSRSKILSFNDGFKKLYITKSISIYSNLDKKNKDIGNVNFVKKVKKGEIDISRIAFMKREEVCPERWKIYIEKVEANNKYQFEENKSIVTDQFKCGKCKSIKCSYYALQIRSCDEPETLFITCINCKNKWKQEG